MYLTYKLTRGTIKAIVSDAEPWQIALGAFLGTLIGFLPILFPPSILGLGILALVCLLNVHIGSVLLFFAIGKVLAKTLKAIDVPLIIGDRLNGLAQGCADSPLLFYSNLSHTGYLGQTLLGVAFAPLFAIFMLWFTRWFRAWLKAKLEANTKLAKFADRPLLIRVACWFLGM